MEAHLRNRRYVVGEQLSAADLILAYTLDWAGQAGLLENRPVLRDYVERMYARPRAAPRIAEAFASLGL